MPFFVEKIEPFALKSYALQKLKIIINSSNNEEKIV